MANDAPTIIPPKNSEPVSPIKILAGCKLKNKKPRDEPINIAPRKLVATLSNLTAPKQTSSTPTVSTQVEARPSTPSVRFTEFTIPQSSINAKM